MLIYRCFFFLFSCFVSFRFILNNFTWIKWTFTEKVWILMPFSTILSSKMFSFNFRTPPPILAAAPLGSGIQTPEMLSAVPLVPPTSTTSTKSEVRNRNRKRNACEMEFESSNNKHAACRNGASRQPPPDNYSRTDLIFLVVFPLLFVLFNLCYWSTFYIWRYGFSDDDSAEFVVNK